ncbi:MAG: TetR/AcrR family transcriptional regulator C-terminal domain-containing protein [Eubacterium sp.]|nr:TetR/AcrR family transcriptional regulator C-terminal domain-containing protein [Eubacterium sp.]
MPDANITKKALATSMKKLMKDKAFDKISVIDICEGCGMNRKSFYYHFKDKYDLVNWIFYTEFITLASSKSFDSGWDLVKLVVELFYEDRDFYRSALEITGQNSFWDYFYESTIPIFSLFIGDLDEDAAKMNTHYISDAFLVIMHRWLENDDGTTPEEMVAKMRNVIVTLSGKIVGMDKKQA